MGGGPSIFQSSFQSINNDILQQSKETCVNVCVQNDSLTEIFISNSDISGSVNLKTGCIISGASCIQKASLNDSIINSQKNQMSANISETAGLLTILNDLATIGQTQTINQSNYQTTTNDITQSVSSVCNFRNESNDNTNVIDITNANISGAVNINKQQVIGNSRCVQVNNIKNYLQNSQTNTMKAKITKTGCCANLFSGIISIIFLALVVKLLSGMISGNSSADKQCDPSQNTEGQDENACQTSPGQDTDTDTDTDDTDTDAENNPYVKAYKNKNTNQN